MAEYLAPGVYVEEVSFRAPSIEGVGTSTTAFAGLTLTGPANQTPELLTSFGDFQNIYGGFDNLAIIAGTDPKNTNYLALSVKAFFDNGGSQLYVSRVFVPASGTQSGVALAGSKSTVAVTARFPGAYGNQTVSVTLKNTKTQKVSSLPSGSLVAMIPAGSASVATLTTVAQVAVLSITISPPLTGTAPGFVLVDSEVMAVTAVDATGTTLTVTRGANHTIAVMHQAGAQVYVPVASLSADIGTGDPQMVLSASVSTILPAGIVAAFLQVDGEIVTVTSVDGKGTTLQITRAANGTAAASHSAGAPVFAPVEISFYTNGTTNVFSNGQVTLPATATNLYVLTMQITANSASGSPQVYDGLGFDPAHPNYLGAALGATPPRHIDALENQIAFVIGSDLKPVTLYQAIFGEFGSPLTNTSQTFVLQGGDDGLEPESTDYDNALAYFTALEDVAIVAAPGSGIFNASQAIINSLITHVSQQRAYRIAILETPPNQIASDNENVRSQIDSSYAALYGPWVIAANPLATSGSSIRPRSPCLRPVSWPASMREATSSMASRKLPPTRWFSAQSVSSGILLSPNRAC